MNPLLIKRGKSRAINAENLTGRKERAECFVLRGLNSYFQMPFGHGAKIVLVNDHPETLPVFFYQIDYILYDEMPSEIEYFHASWRRQAITEKGKDYVIADGIRGRGRYVGTYIALSTLERYWWGEGEVKFYIDGDQKFPTICGTGMEDYFKLVG